MLSAARKFVFGAYGLDEPNAARLVMPMGLPASLMRKDLPTVWGANPVHYTQYVVSPKADGERILVGWFRWNQTQVGFTMDRKGAAKKTPWGLHAAAYEGTLLDCELITRETGNVLWVFDALLVNGHSVRNQAYHMRLYAALVFLEQMGGQPGVVREAWESPAPQSVLQHALAGCYVVHAESKWKLAVKPIWYHTQVQRAWEWVHRMPTLVEDGLIFTPVTKAVSTYRALDLFKWKDTRHHTVDFLVRDIPNEPQNMELFVVDEQNAPVYYTTVPLRVDHPNLLVQPNTVYECRWDSTEKTWFIFKAREDKALPNAKLTADRTCQTIAENIQLAELVPLSPLGFPPTKRAPVFQPTK